MHEASVAQSVVEAIEKAAQERSLRPARAVISCGQLNALNNEAFALAFEAITQGTPCEGMTIDIDHKPFRAHCKPCDKDFDIGIDTVVCPLCQQDDFTLLPDAPLLLETIEFEED